MSRYYSIVDRFTVISVTLTGNVSMTHDYDHKSGFTGILFINIFLFLPVPLFNINLLYILKISVFLVMLQ